MPEANWPRSLNFYQAPRARHWARSGMPRVGLPYAARGYAPGTPARFGPPAPMGYAQIAQAAAQPLPAAAFLEAGAVGLACTGCPRAGRCGGCGCREAGQAGTEFAYVDELAPTPTNYAPPMIPGIPRGSAFGPCGPAGCGPTPDELAAMAAMAPGVVAGPYGMVGPPPEQATIEPDPVAIETFDMGPPITPATEITTPKPEPQKPTPWGWILGGSAAVAALVGGGAYLASRKRARG